MGGQKPKPLRDTPQSSLQQRAAPRTTEQPQRKFGRLLNQCSWNQSDCSTHIDEAYPWRRDRGCQKTGNNRASGSRDLFEIKRFNARERRNARRESPPTHLVSQPNRGSLRFTSGCAPTEERSDEVSEACGDPPQIAPNSTSDWPQVAVGSGDSMGCGGATGCNDAMGGGTMLSAATPLAAAIREGHASRQLA